MIQFLLREDRDPAFGGTISSTSTPLGASKRNKAGSGDVFTRVSEKTTRVTLPNRSTTSVATTSPVSGSTVIRSTSYADGWIGVSAIDA